MGGKNRTVEFTCVQCGVTFKARRRWDRVVQYCSTACYGIAKRGRPGHPNPCKPETRKKLSDAKKGRRVSPATEFKPGSTAKDANPNWKGGRITTSQGYVMVLAPGHHRAIMRGRYVMESILVAEEVLGRPLTADETLHHINENRTDNRPENLYLFPDQASHKRYHMNVRHGKEPRIETSNLP